MRGFIGVTDRRWADFLAADGATEVNFWLPSAKTFRALQVGEPFLFKTHWPDNRIVGGGFFEHFTVLRTSEAWEFLGPGNGAASAASLVDSVNGWRPEHGDDRDPEIGCVILNDAVFFDPVLAPPGPQSFSKNIVRGKGYDLPSGDQEVQSAFDLLFSAGVPGDVASRGVRANRLRREGWVRLGQGGFRAVILENYAGRCAVTGHKIRPTLQAAHIKPVADGGEHRADNGLLLRSDVHTMFDRGYLTVDKNARLRVSSRLRDDFGNGEEFYSRQGDEILLPQRAHDRPRAEFLEWHGDEVFLG